jgi:hypothetical protein
MILTGFRLREPVVFEIKAFAPATATKRERLPSICSLAGKSTQVSINRQISRFVPLNFQRFIECIALVPEVLNQSWWETECHWPCDLLISMAAGNNFPAELLAGGKQSGK